jgi:multidrug efflux pump subunit AcrB
MPEGTPVEDTAAVMRKLSAYIASVPEVVDYQAYAGTASPINFNGLVRQYYLREGAFVGDIQVNLAHKSERARKSHEIAQAMREPLQQIARPMGANVKIVEVPPGPPVMSPLVAEIYGLDYPGQVAVARKVREVFEQTDNIVDVDDSVEANSDKLLIQVDRQKAALFGVSQQDISELVFAALHGEDVGYLHGTDVKYPVPIRIELPVAEKVSKQSLLDLKVAGRDGNMVALSELVHIIDTKREISIYHKDLMPVVFVTADMAGELDSPLYGMFDIYAQLQDKPLVQGKPLQQNLLSPPQTPHQFGLKWDGEWQITYETFRDMGIAYSIGLLMIYLLVVAQFGSYLVPLIIMAPIPLTIIGVMPGHAILGAQFTATSMIGMIALAGIIVRNSILLVDFINEQVRKGMNFQDAVIQSGAVRAKPIVLTGLAAMLGALFILDDPIFSGLAISLIFGILVSTLLTLLVIPVMYYAFRRKRME